MTFCRSEEGPALVYSSPCGLELNFSDEVAKVMPIAINTCLLLSLDIKWPSCHNNLVTPKILNKLEF